MNLMYIQQSYLIRWTSMIYKNTPKHATCWMNLLQYMDTFVHKWCIYEGKTCSSTSCMDDMWKGKMSIYSTDDKM